MTAETFMMSQKILISKIFCSFKHSINQRILKMNHDFHKNIIQRFVFNIDDNTCS